MHFLRHEGMLDLLKEDSGVDLRQGFPRDQGTDLFDWLCNILLVAGAGGEEAIKAPVTDQRPGSCRADPDASSVDACCDQELFGHGQGVVLRMLHLREDVIPVMDSRKRVGLAVCVKDNQRDGDFSERELMNQALPGLTGQVPQQDLADFFVPPPGFDFSMIKVPDMPGMRRFGWRKGLACENQGQSAFADACIAHEHHFGVGVVDRGGRRGGQQCCAQMQTMVFC